MRLCTALISLARALPVYSAEIAGQIRDHQGGIFVGARVRMFSGACTMAESVLSYGTLAEPALPRG